MKAAAERDARVRLEGNKNLIAVAQQTGLRRFLVQSTGFWYAPGRDLADEGERFAYGAMIQLITVEREIINIAPKRSGIHWKTRRHRAIGWMITLFCPALHFHSAKPKSLLSP
jgi:hypothetical protein